MYTSRAHMAVCQSFGWLSKLLGNFTLELVPTSSCMQHMKLWSVNVVHAWFQPTFCIMSVRVVCHILNPCDQAAAFSIVIVCMIKVYFGSPCQLLPADNVITAALETSMHKS